MSITGQRLSVYDETVLLALLILSKRQKSPTVETNPNELCSIMGVSASTHTYNAIWNSIDYLVGTKIRLDEIKGKGKNRRLRPLMINTILTGATADVNSRKKIIVTLNPYFIQMYTESFITNIDFNLRKRLKSDIAKVLYRFYESQRGDTYNCHILTIAKAINISLHLPLYKIRDRIRRAHAELKRCGYLSRAMIKKNDVAHIWKAGSSRAG